MCTLAVFRGISARFPLVVAANRDEFLDRPSSPPSRLESLPEVVAGLDLEASGTWLGMRVDGPLLIAGLLNRRSSGLPPPQGKRSRGLLCLDVLAGRTIAATAASLDAAVAARYAPFNLFIADARRAVVIDNAKGVGLTELEEGLSVLTNLDVNDPRCIRLASAVPRFEAVAALLASRPDIALSDLLSGLATVMGDHSASCEPGGEDPLARLCVHTPDFGTRSASILVVSEEDERRYFHADGPPCRSSFIEVNY